MLGRTAAGLLAFLLTTNGAAAAQVSSVPEDAPPEAPAGTGSQAGSALPGAERHAEAIPDDDSTGTSSPGDVAAAQAVNTGRTDLGPCDLEREAGEKTVDRARRGLWVTACHAALWFDGLFGEERHPASARNTTGRVEMSYIYSEHDGSRIRSRVNVRMRFPNISNRIEAFAGRDDEDRFVRDRNEGFALRSQFLDLENDENWVAGFGYGLPGNYLRRSDFRVGAKGGRTPEIFVQGRHRRNWYVGTRDLWHFRETVFWTNRDGFGSTTSLDFDHLLSRSLLVRWGTIGTVSEATDGLDWRSVLVFYKDLPGHRALANELFVRGETHNEVGTTEFGLRIIYRQSILHRDWLWGELISGYSWPRYLQSEARAGSLALGFGFEMLLGRSDAVN